MRLSTVPVPIGRRPAARHPISRWYVGPAAQRAARWLAPSRIRPVHLTIAGLLAAGGAAAVLWFWPTAGAWAAPLVAVAWFCDRADGMLARYQFTASAWGAWLDANVDELVDVGLHVAVAAAAARLSGSSLPWFLVLAFVAGKYLLFRGIDLEAETTRKPIGSAAEAFLAENRRCHRRTASSGTHGNFAWLRRCYHLPGNADVRVHLLIAALLTGCLTAELAVVAVYYNVRWMARYVLVARRLGGAR